MLKAESVSFLFCIDGSFPFDCFFLGKLSQIFDKVGLRPSFDQNQQHCTSKCYSKNSTKSCCKKLSKKLY